jgi:hypothetical protein
LGFDSIKEIVNIDHVDSGLGANPAQKLLRENLVFEVSEPHQVIPSRSCREPIRRCSRGECHLKAAIPEKQHIRIPSKGLRRRFSVKIEGSVLILGITRSVAIGEVLIGIVPIGLTGKDGISPEMVRIGTESSDHNNAYMIVGRLARRPSHALVHVLDIIGKPKAVFIISRSVNQPAAAGGVCNGSIKSTNLQAEHE